MRADEPLGKRQPLYRCGIRVTERGAEQIFDDSVAVYV